MSGYATRTIPDVLAKQLEGVGLPRPPSTLGELVELFRSTQGPISDVSALCCEDDSPHEIRIGEEMWHTHCVLDTLMLAVVVGREGVVRSVSPLTGEVVELHVRRDGIDGGGANVVVSFGLSREGTGTFYEIGCPYINAFASMEHYERWAAATPEAVTIPLTLDEAFAFGRALAGQ